MQSISELIRTERAASGLSYRDLAARAESAGYSLKFQYLHELANSGPKSWPKNTDTFRALSEMLKIPVREVILAYAVDLGLDVEGVNSELATRLPERTENLSSEMTEALLRLIRTAVSESAEDAAPASSKDVRKASKKSSDELSLAADSSDSAGKQAEQGFDTIGEETQESKQRWRRK
ncbi:transcriptional regulator with XRE-family HTH domain [Psychromicrobium silvestre]|uniref:Transcriptional regulator with XRE-family HTH domain n=1 Tax=Psychromicrobium silvestre TaxID=1645614 RepID=A0A7Y9LVC0_9MICC|nr:hypothetical protein [Psychromicrobium silvestre]NYE96256.1 transcriptional regulator with XRE-family HTH domain [Psychromicrobium silvestre]